MNFWKRIWQFQYGLAAIGGGICLLLIIGMTVAMVFGRYVLHVDLIPGAYNIIERVIFPLLVFAAVPEAFREGLFPRFDLLSAKLSPGVNKAVDLFVLLVELLIYGLLFWLTFNFVTAAYESNRTVQVGTDVVPMWPVILLIPVALALMVLEMLRSFYLRLVRIANA